MTAAIQLPNSQAARLGARVSDIAVLLPADFRLMSGERLSRPELQLRLHGDPSNPVVAVAGGISAGRVVADAGAETGWWRDIVGEGASIDLGRFCVIGFDFLPNAGETARTISTHDQARALARALSSLKIESLAAFVGASYGGMVGLAFAEKYPRRIGRLCAISAADRPHPVSTALRGVQRRIVEFARRCGAGAEGVSLARQLAMVTYRTPEEFAARFAHAPGAAAGDAYEVCEYLIARGEAYRMSPERYVTLSDSIDRHQVKSSNIGVPSLFIASKSDRLVPAEDMRRLAGEIVNARYFEFDSLFGHDAFLKETATIGPVIKSFIED